VLDGTTGLCLRDLDSWQGSIFFKAECVRYSSARSGHISGEKMKLILTFVAMLSWAILPVAEAATEQQNKMVTCNKEATGKKGDERKAFMKECLSKKPAAAEAAPAAEPPANAQQSKMATCNKEASGKKGDERKKFMSECLKAK
jgi:hypothetical protein